MDIKFYKLKLNEKQLNKTLNEPIATISGHFRTVFNSLNLQIELKYESYKNLISANYLSLQIENDIQRYFFVLNKKINNGLLILECYEDVLNTFKDDIKKSGGIAIRSSNGSFYLPEELNLSKGTRVRVTAGPLEGQEGVFLKVKGARDRRLVIHIEGVIAVARALVHPELVQVIG